jgi:hypothetical protein
VAPMKMNEQPGVDNPGVVDGDMLADVLADFAPPEWTAEASRALAMSMLIGMHQAGFVILRGPDSQPWIPPDHTAERTPEGRPHDGPGECSGSA